VAKGPSGPFVHLNIEKKETNNSLTVSPKTQDAIPLKDSYKDQLENILHGNITMNFNNV